jgi:hypothetical protein
MLQNYAGFTCSTEIRAERTVNISMFAGSEYSYDFYAYKIHFEVFFNSADNIRGNDVDIPILTSNEYSNCGLLDYDNIHSSRWVPIYQTHSAKDAIFITMKTLNVIGSEYLCEFHDTKYF